LSFRQKTIFARLEIARKQAQFSVVVQFEIFLIVTMAVKIQTDHYRVFVWQDSSL